jgi:RNA polymerase sigma-70 factor (ECF subfamily)
MTPSTGSPACFSAMADAEEVVQEIYVKLLEQRATLPEAVTRAWLYRVVLNACMDYRKSWWQRRREGPGALMMMGDGRPSPEQVVLESERAGGLRRALQGLPRRLRAAVILRDIEGLSYEELASLLNCGVGTVSSRLNRGRRILAKVIER